MSTEFDRDAAKSGIVRRTKTDPELTAAIAAGRVEEVELRRQELADNHAHGMAKLKQGALGSWLGSGTDKSGNIAFAVIIICFILIILMACKLDMNKDFDNFFKFCAPLFSIITGALGYLFGAKNTGD